MRENNTYITPFEITINLEGGYYRLNITHPEYRGRTRKRIGNGGKEMHDTLLSHLKVELEKHFTGNEISKEAVDSFVNYYVDMYYKKSASIFDYFPEFLNMKRKTYNENTGKFLTRASLLTYERTCAYFQKYMTRLVPPLKMNSRSVFCKCSRRYNA